MLRAIKSVARRLLRPPLHKREIKLRYELLGTDYGGWPLLVDHTPRAPLIYSFGVGEDISFDLAAIQRYGAHVHAFDPTPRSLAWIGGQTLPDAFVFHPVGIAAVDDEVEFFAPEKLEHVSFSSTPARMSDPALAVKAPVRRLQTLIAELGTRPPDILKMDIEGFEYAVVEDLVASPLRPGQLLIEFHHRIYDVPDQMTRDAIGMLHGAGYRIFRVASTGHEYALVHENLISH